MNRLNLFLFMVATLAGPAFAQGAESEKAPDPAPPAAASPKKSAADAVNPESVTRIPPSDPFLSAGSFVDEVMSQATGPHVYDWRDATAEIEVGMDYADEANNYDTDGWHLGGSVPTSSGFLVRFLIRRMYVHATKAGELIAKTPFRQAAQPTRYELALGGAWALLEGRAMSRLSPWLSDVQNAMLATFGVHYTDPNSGTIPKMGDDTGTLPGQKKTYSAWNLELGLRWNIYLPAGFGLFFEMQKNYPRTANQPGFSSWQTFTAGALWSFGGK